MRFMMMMIPKGYESADAGHDAGRQGRRGDDEVQRGPAEGGGAAGAGRPAPALDGRARVVRGRQAQGHRRALRRGEGGARRLLDDPGQVARKRPSSGPARCPAGENEVIEVRQVQEFADFPQDIQEAAAKFPELKAQHETPRRQVIHGEGPRAGPSASPLMPGARRSPRAARRNSAVRQAGPRAHRQSPPAAAESHCAHPFPGARRPRRRFQSPGHLDNSQVQLLATEADRSAHGAQAIPPASERSGSGAWQALVSRAGHKG